MKKRIGFLSYARRDMDNPLSTSIRTETFDAITKEVNNIFGGNEFSLWEDTKKLRIGDQWRDHIHSELNTCDFLIPLVSPGFLRSKNCREEFDVFVQANRDADLDGRILPILLRQIPTQSQRFTREARDFLEALKKFERKDWQALEDLDPDKKRKVFRTTAQDIAEQINALDAVTNSTSNFAPASVSSAKPLPVDSSTVPVASGYFARSVQSPNAVLANLAFSGPAHVATEHGRVVFSVSSATLTAKAIGARITDQNLEFGADGWAGPNAHIQRVSANPYLETLRITAHHGALQGEVLCGRGEQGLVRLFDLDSADGNITLSGKLSIDVMAVVISDAAEAEDPRAKRQAQMKAKLAELVHKKLGLGKIDIEDFGDG